MRFGVQYWTEPLKLPILSLELQKMNVQLKILIILLLLPFLGFGQFGQGGVKAVKKLQKTETLVILGYGEAYNDAIKEAFEKHWTFTKFRFISGTQYADHCGNSKYSFVQLLTIKDWQFTREQYDDIGIVLGGICKTAPEDMIAYANMDVYDDGYYRLECKRAVQFMQQYLEIVLERSLPKDNDKEILKYYASKHQQMEGNTFIFSPTDLRPEIREIEKLKKHYKHPVQLETGLFIDRAVWKEEKGYLYTLYIFDLLGYSYHFVIKTENNEILYAIPTRSGQGYLVSNPILKKFNSF